MSRCAIYARFSTDRQSETSAEDQVRDCRRRADREGWTVVDVYTDLAISGANNRRPGLTAMLADAASGAFDIVCAEALDRIARDQADIATIYQRLSFAGVRIETMTEGAVNELHIGLKGTMGALFLKDLADKIRRGQRGAVSRGRVPGGLCYGYEVVRELDERGEVQPGRRRVVPEQAAVVRRIVEEYAAGRSPKAIAHDLNREGIRSARGGDWQASAIVGNRARQIGILHNPIYVGRLVYNRVRMVRDPDTRLRISRPNAAAELETAEMPDLRIVSDELWAAVQEARQVRAAAPLPVRRRPKHIFSGLVRCGSCGGTMAIVADTRLGCTRAREAGTCDHRIRVRLGELQARVLTGLEAQLVSAEAVSLLVREYHQQRDEDARSRARESQGAARKLKAAEAVVDRLVGVLASGGADFADIRSELGRRIEERDRLREETAEVAAAPVIALQPQIVELYRARVRAMVAAIAAGGTPAEAEAAELRALVDAIVVTPREEGGHDIEIVGSLAAVLAAVRPGPTKRATRLAGTVVAEESYQRRSQGRRTKV